MIDFEDTHTAFRGMDDEALRATTLVYRGMASAWMTGAGSGMARVGLSLGVPLVARVLKKTVFGLFCGGTTLEEACLTARRLAAVGVGTILDYAVEGEHTDAGFDSTMQGLLRTIEAAQVTEAIRFVALKPTGLAPAEVLEKLHKGDALSPDEAAAWERANARFDAIARAAAAAHVPVFVDAEDSWLQKPVDDVCERLMRRYNRDAATTTATATATATTRPLIHTTVQLYLRQGLETLDRLISQAKAGGYRLGVKLVRGAYLEKERERARALGIEAPVHATKEVTDAAFDTAVDLCLREIAHVSVCVATHNVKSIENLLERMDAFALAPGDERIWASQLLGMLDRITMPLALGGYNAAKYVPYGPMREVMPYLLRRADENKSVAAQAHGELEFLRREMRRRGLRG